jgi:hypothetical protein
MTGVRRHYDGNSEACCDCKRFYREGGESNAPCDTCEYRGREEEAIKKAGDAE